MPNLKQTISAHNKSVLKTTNTTSTALTQPKRCNCGPNTVCPLDGNCQASGVIYQATVTRSDSQRKETYIGLTELTFKTRFNCHTGDFNTKHKKQRNATALSQYVWSLKVKNIDYNITWRIVARSQSYSTSTKRCNLCITEKYFIIHKPHMSSLNHRNELVSGCRHRRKHLLCNVK